MRSEVQSIVVVGEGGLAASVAVATAISLRGSGVRVSLLLQGSDQQHSSDQWVDVFRGGAQGFHTLLGIDESRLCQQTGATFGMGARYRGITESGEDVFVPLGSHGMTLRLVDFHHYVAKLRAADGPQDLNDWSAAAAAAQAEEFNPDQSGVEPALRLYEYDIFVDSNRYRSAMLSFASNLGISVVKQSLTDTVVNADGMIELLSINDGTNIPGELFIDCTAERSLIGRVAPDDDFEDWSHLLASDQFHAVQETSEPVLLGPTESEWGWESSTGFSPGRYTSHWTRNCVAIGPAAASLAPLEFSALQLTHRSILQLLALLPRSKSSPALSTEFNRLINIGIDSVYDYQLLRLALTSRDQQDLWPDSLRRRIELFRSTGRISPVDNEFVSKANWVSSFINFGVWPDRYDPLADMADERRVRADLERFKIGLQSRP